MVEVDKQKPVKTEPKSFARRDALLAIEQRIQEQWSSQHTFERNAGNPDDRQREKVLVTFPYPYMNGRMHLGHGFTITKAEFATRFHQLCGRDALFPFGLHCSGMPIKACADKLKREMELFGNPPQFPEVETEAAPEETPEATSAETAEPTTTEAAETAAPASGSAPNESGKFKSRKSKTASKSGTVRFQWQIMRGMGVPESEIHRFADANFWLKYFPPFAVRDLKRFGLQVDWRRSFITTDVNAFYDSFIRWQFEKLRAGGRIIYGKRYAIYSPLDGQACADHDRASGEGVGPEEYTLIKMRVRQPYPEQLAHFAATPSASNANDSTMTTEISLVAATLRPETMVGQTNCWVHPDIEYGVFDVTGPSSSSSTESAGGTPKVRSLFVCTERAARNLSFQGYSPRESQVERVGTILGSALIGTAVHAPLSPHEQAGVYVLPMMTVSADKGTGVVTSVPSDSPDDYAAWMDIRNKPALREKYGVRDEMVMPFELIPIIRVPELGDMAAQAVCEKMKIKSQNDRVKLREAHELVYKLGFYQGTLIAGPFIGDRVQDAKIRCRDLMLSRGDAIVYAEPERPVVSRSGDDCVVALTDQWYIRYGEDSWRGEVQGLLDDAVAPLECYNPSTANAFRETVAWLREWACSRSFGLGTRLPWDEQWLIDSLSDSTIYMAYYTICHLLQGGSLDGSSASAATGPDALVLGSPSEDLGITPAQMNSTVWDYIFLGTRDASDSSDSINGISMNVLDRLRREFRYWYPVDLRVSGKDLIKNHLTMFLYNHAAIFPREHWPRSVFANGHVMVNGEKMSKSLGNFLTLEDAIERYGTDATRVALADAGDGLDDANFVEDVANMAILRLTTQLAWTEEMIRAAPTMRNDPELGFFDRVFDATIDGAIRVTTENFKRMMFREALHSGFFELQIARDRYRSALGATSDSACACLHRRVIERFIRVQTILLAPIAPHYSEHVWNTLLGEQQSMFSADAGSLWPTPASTEAENHAILEGAEYLESVIREMRLKLLKESKPKKPAAGAAAPAAPVVLDAAVVFVADGYNEVQKLTLEILRAAYDVEKREWATDLPKRLGDNATVKPHMKKVMLFVAQVKESVSKSGVSALNSEPAFNERALLLDQSEFVRVQLNLKRVDIRSMSDDESGKVFDPANRRAQVCVPGTPYAVFVSSSSL